MKTSSNSMKALTSYGADLKILGLSKSFGKHPVLRQLDLEIAPGEFVAVVGRSGSGKSTLLRLIAGLDRPTQGGILQDGELLRQLNPSARVMFQDARLLLWRKVLQNVGLGLRHNWRDKALDALRQVGLEDRAQDWPAILSGGQRQRVALARALVSDPRLLLLDEPLGALDALTRIEMQRLIENIWQTQQFTALLITHDIDEAVALGDRVVVLEAGGISLDLTVDLPRPRDRTHPKFVRTVEHVLERVVNTGAYPKQVKEVQLSPTFNAEW
jgi:sulfonate transport system ATP-binding protein